MYHFDQASTSFEHHENENLITRTAVLEQEAWRIGQLATPVFDPVIGCPGRSRHQHGEQQPNGSVRNFCIVSFLRGFGFRTATPAVSSFLGLVLDVLGLQDSRPLMNVRHLQVLETIHGTFSAPVSRLTAGEAIS